MSSSPYPASTPRSRKATRRRLVFGAPFLLAALLLAACNPTGSGTAPRADAPPKAPAPAATAQIPVEPPPLPPPVDTTRFFSMNGIVPFHLAAAGWTLEQNRADLQKRLRLIKQHGAHSVRIDLWWGSIEPAKGQWKWELPDMIMDEIKAAGLEPYPILCYNAAWSPSQSPNTPAMREEFAQYVHQVVQRYKGRARYWEVWNEPNITPFWVANPNAADYAELLKVAYKEIKTADPAALVVGMCTAGPDYPFIENAYRAGAANAMDALSYHHYDDRPDETVIEDEIRTIRGIMTKYGDAAKPLLITEIGLSTGRSSILKSVSQEFQSDWSIKKHLIGIAEGCDQYYYFKFIDDKPEKEPDGFWGLLDWEWNPKIWSKSYEAMTARLSGSQFLGRAYNITVSPNRKKDVTLLLFARGQDVIACGWVRADGPPCPVRIPASAPVTLHDSVGSLLATLTPDPDGLVTVELTSSPRYIQGLAEPARLLASVRFQPETLYLSPGTTLVANLLIHNPTSQPIAVNLDELLNPPDRGGLRITAPERKIPCQPGETKRVPVTITLALGVNKFKMQEYTFCDSYKYSYALRVLYNRPFDISLFVDKAEGDEFTLVTTFQNALAQTISGKVDWTLRGAAVGGPRRFLNLPAGARAAITRKLKPATNPVDIRATVIAEHGASSSARLLGWGQPIVSRPFTIDADLADWADIAPVVITPDEHQIPDESGRVPRLAANEFQGQIRIAWTRDTLYLAADVTDSTPLICPESEIGTNLWKGDSLELYLGFHGPSQDPNYAPGQFQIGISPGDAGKDGYAWNWKPQFNEGAALLSKPPVDGVKIEQAQVAVAPREGGYLLEVAIPLSALGQQIAPDTLIGFDFALNNRIARENPDQRAPLMWNGGSRNWRDPSGWGFAVLRPE